MNKNQRVILEKFLKSRPDLKMWEEEFVIPIERDVFTIGEYYIKTDRCRHFRADAVLTDKYGNFYCCEVNPVLDARTIGQILIDKFMIYRDWNLRQKSWKFLIICNCADKHLRELCKLFGIEVVVV